MESIKIADASTWENSIWGRGGDGKTHAQHLAAHIKQTTGCPIVQAGCPLKLPRESFIKACKKTQKKRGGGWCEDGKHGVEFNICIKCKIGAAIQSGDRFKQPKWVEFVALKQLIIKP